MKKRFVFLVAAVLVCMFTACGQPNGSANSSGGDLGLDEAKGIHSLIILEDGDAAKAGGFPYDGFRNNLTEVKISDTTYAAATVADILGKDISTYQGVFLVSTDGFVSYYGDLASLWIAVYSKEGSGSYEAFRGDGGDFGYLGVTADGFVNRDVSEIYLVTTPLDFTVDIQVNGRSAGTLTSADFMKKTPVGDNWVFTGLFDGSFKYDGGSSTHTGRFLGIDYATMLAKLKSLGIELSGEIKEVEYYGINGVGVVGKNTEYGVANGADKRFDQLDFFCMFDGKTVNDVAGGQQAVGLTVFYNGTGSRWITHELNTINFIIE